MSICTNFVMTPTRKYEHRSSAQRECGSMQSSSCQRILIESDTRDFSPSCCFASLRHLSKVQPRRVHIQGASSNLATPTYESSNAIWSGSNLRTRLRLSLRSSLLTSRNRCRLKVSCLPHSHSNLRLV